MFYSNDNLSLFFLDFNDPDLFKRLKNPICSNKDELMTFIKTKENTSLSSDEIVISQNIYKTRSGFQFHNIFTGHVAPISYDEVVSAIESF